MTRKTFKRVITSPELSEKINPKNKKLAERFLREKDVRSSSGTVEGYKSDLEIFFTWNLTENDNKFFVDVKKLELAEFFSFTVSELRWSSSRFSRMRSCLSSFSQFIVRFFDEDYPTFKNLVLLAVESMPKNAVREKTILSEEQVNGLLKYLVDNKEYQDSCWLSLAIASGARFSELLRFTTDLIDENKTAFDGIFLESTRAIKTKGRTKSGKMLVKYIIKDIFLPYYHLWLKEREEIMTKNNKDHKSIFIKENGDPAEAGSVRSWLTKFEKFLDVPFYPHCTRHFSTTYLSKVGLPATLIKEIFGWESVDLVSLYDDTNFTEKKWKELDNLKDVLKSNKDKEDNQE
jgi:site-specific recombinase XerD